MCVVKMGSKMFKRLLASAGKHEAESGAAGGCGVTSFAT